MSSTVARARTLRVVNVCRARLGEYHPATWAAYARARNVWGSRVQLPRFPDDIEPELHARLCAAYTTADLRARGADGWQNRRERKQRRALTK